VASYRSGGILHVPRRPGTAAFCCSCFCFACGESWRAADASSPIVGMKSGGTRTWVACSNAYARPISVGSSQRPPMNVTAERQRPDEARGHRDVGVAAIAAGLDDRRTSRSRPEVAVDRVGDPRRAVRRGDDRVEVVRCHRVVDRRLGDRRRDPREPRRTPASRPPSPGRGRRSASSSSDSGAPDSSSGWSLLKSIRSWSVFG
jgi:hypothetical protein